MFLVTHWRLYYGRAGKFVTCRTKGEPSKGTLATACRYFSTAFPGLWVGRLASSHLYWLQVEYRDEIENVSGETDPSPLWTVVGVGAGAALLREEVGQPT